MSVTFVSAVGRELVEGGEPVGDRHAELPAVAIEAYIGAEPDPSHMLVKLDGRSRVDIAREALRRGIAS